MRVRVPDDGAEAGLRLSRDTGRGKDGQAHATNYEYLELQLK